MAMTRRCLGRHPFFRSFLSSVTRTALVLLVGVTATTSAAANFEWNNEDAGSWFDASNWSPQGIPSDGSVATINNGGLSILDAGVGDPTQTGLLDALRIGFAGAAGPLEASGSLQSSGVEVQTKDTLIGVVDNPGGDSAQATGSAVSDGLWWVDGGTVRIGDSNVSGSSAAGSLVVEELSGTVSGGISVGSGTALDEIVQGELIARGGELRVENGSVRVGRGSLTFVASEAETSGSSEAEGYVRLEGALEVAGEFNDLTVGRGLSHRAEGTLELGSLIYSDDSAAIRSALVGVGLSSEVVGRVVVDSGDMRIGLSLDVGSGAIGTLELNDGNLDFRDALTMRIGQSSLSLDEEEGVVGKGSVLIRGGIAGVVGGIIVGEGSTASAEGSIHALGNAGVLRTEYLGIGLVPIADGEVSISGTGTFSSGGSVETDTLFVGAAAGARSMGVGDLHVGGDLSIFGVLGEFSAPVAGIGVAIQAGFAQGAATVDGDLVLESDGSFWIGRSDPFGEDASTPGGELRVTEAVGRLDVLGSLNVIAGGSLLDVGRSSDGNALGEVVLNQVHMEEGTAFASVHIGSSRAGDATGSVEIRAGTLRAEELVIGHSESGTAHGELVLTDTNLVAGRVDVGTGTGTGSLQLRNSMTTVAGDMTLGSGLLSMQESLLDVGSSFLLGADAILEILVSGEDRGTGYAAIDASAATLGGLLRIDLSDLVPFASVMVFDLLIAESGGILGDFDAFAFEGLLDGFSAFTSLSQIGGFDVYQLRLTAMTAVPEPRALGLLLLGLLLLVAARRRAMS